MAQAPQPRPRTPVLISAAAFVVVIAGMRATQSILVPFFLAIFFAVITSPVLYWLQRKRVPQWASLLIVIAGVLGLGMLMAVLVSSSIGEFSRALPGYQARLQAMAEGVVAWLHEMDAEIPSQVDRVLLQYLDPGVAVGYVSNLLAQLGNVLTNVMLILLITIFILIEASGLPAKLRAAFGVHTPVVEHVSRFTRTVNRYVAIKTSISLTTGILAAVWLTILGVDYAPLWGLLAFLLNYVPNIGSILASIPPIVLAFLELGTGSALLTALGYLVLNGLMGNVVEPRLMGRGLGLSILVVVLSLLFWGWVLGPVGMLLAVPLTMTVKRALESNEGTRWLAILLDSQAPPDADR